MFDSQSDQNPPLTRRSAPPNRVSSPLFPDLGAPRESFITGTFLRDHSLQYTEIPFAGPSTIRVVVLVVGFLVGLALVVAPIVHQISLTRFSFWSLLPLAGVPLCLELLFPMLSALSDLRDRLFFNLSLRNIELGMERSVPQTGATLRYEVHLAAKRKICLDSVQVRVVFWESWHGRDRLRFLRIPIRSIQKHGHDLVRQEMGTLLLAKGQQAVIRGFIRIPQTRPSEHYRSEHKHMSYVNLTITLQAAPSHTANGIRGNSPLLVTFPWM